MHSKDKKQLLRTADLPLMTSKIRGTEVSPESILSSRRTDSHLHMTRDGESDRISNSIRYLNRIHSGGHIRSTMVNYGISIIIVLI